MVWWQTLLISLGPALIVLALTHAFLWARANRDLKLSVVENGIKALYSDLELFHKIKDLLEIKFNEKYSVSQYDQAFSNMKQDFAWTGSWSQNGWNIRKITLYEPSLKPLLTSHVKTRGQLLFILREILERDKEGMENKQKKALLDIKDYEEECKKKLSLLENQIHLKSRNPFTRPISLFWHSLKETFFL